VGSVEEGCEIRDGLGRLWVLRFFFWLLDFFFQITGFVIFSFLQEPVKRKNLYSCFCKSLGRKLLLLLLKKKVKKKNGL